ncbi:MAG TPA: crossover junction endodeoxyribonuclease RuvC [Puia sp.]
MQKQSKIILGIDPGMVVMGYGLVRCTGSQLQLLEMGVLRLPTKEDNYMRLKLIQNKVQELISRHGPQDFAIEAPFFGKNVQSMLKLGRAQGVAIATAMHAGLTVTEYSPKKVKQSITGNGNAEKEKVWGMLQRILQLEQEIPAYDASDALAVAICHHFHGLVDQKMGGAVKGTDLTKNSRRKKAGSWEDFIQKNPGKLR